MRKIYYLLIISVILCTTGCKNKYEKQLEKAYNNTSITEKGVNSYMAKVNIKTLGFNINYVVSNKNNEIYDVEIINDEHNYNDTLAQLFNIDKENIKTPSYNYNNTDIFLNGLKNGTNITMKEEKIGNDLYKIYNYEVNSNIVNEMIKPFGLSSNQIFNATTYIDSSNHVYLIMYNNLDLNISVSYNRLNNID